MQNNKSFAYILIGFLALFFAFASFEIFKARVELNTVYPEFSSFAADPKGCRILYETLSRVGTLNVDRFVQPLSELPSAAGKTLLLLGVDPESNFMNFKPLDHWLANGGKLIIALKSHIEQGPDREIRSNAGEPADETNLIRKINDWGLRLFRAGRELSGPVQSNLFSHDSTWASQLYLEPTGGDWEILGEIDGLPVVLQRNHGRLVILADSSPLSNAALADHRNISLISWLFPQYATVIFDETHFGIVNRTGIMSLARRYGLDGAFIAILALAILYIWANRYSLKPVRKNPTMATPATPGSGANEMLMALLRRTVPEKDLLPACLRVSKLNASINRMKQARIDASLEALPAASSTVARYNQIVKLHRP